MKREMEAELEFDHPDNRDRAVAQLNKLGFDVVVLPERDEDEEGVVLSETTWIKVRCASELDELGFFRAMSELAESVGSCFEVVSLRETL